MIPHGGTDKRLDPGKLLPGTKSVVSCCSTITTTALNPTAPKLAQYAHGEDYHFVLKWN